jgi:uncharacterized protein (DUF58 family)
MSRGTAALALGAVALAGSWLFGSLVLAPVAIGLLAAALGALLWRRAASRSLGLERRLTTERIVEGDELAIELRLTGGLARLGRAAAHETLGALGEIRVPLSRGRGTLRVTSAPRGRHTVGPARVLLEDPLGLERAEAVAAPAGAVIVRPRTVSLERIFTDGGSFGLDGSRARARRHVGTDLHGVREYREGEPLRLVHWPTTARRGELTVLDMQDAPRDETILVLDCDPRGVAGPIGARSFDEAVRAVASLARACVTRRRAVALVGVADGAALRVTAGDPSLEAALDALAAVEPDERRPLATLLSDPRLAPGRTDVVVVTCRPEALDTAPAWSRPLGGVVLVDAPTYAGRQPSAPATALLRLVASGTPVAVLRAGEDLAAALGGEVPATRSA